MRAAAAAGVLVLCLLSVLGPRVAAFPAVCPQPGYRISGYAKGGAGCLTSPAQCQQACQAELACAFYSYNLVKQDCQFSSQNGTWVADSNFTSGPKLCANDPDPYRCSSDLDCELNGECDRQTGRCACRPGWTGPTCGQLDVAPAASASGVYPSAADQRLDRNDTAYSWGFSLVQEGALGPGGAIRVGNGSWHAWVNVGCYKALPRPSMVSGTFVAHLTGPSERGPWRYEGMTVPASSFNIRAQRVAVGGVELWLLLFRVNDCPPWLPLCNTSDCQNHTVCTGWPTARGQASDGFGAEDQSWWAQIQPHGLYMVTAPTAWGPWTPVKLDGADGHAITGLGRYDHTSNPAIYVDPSGEATLAVRFNAPCAERVGITQATLRLKHRTVPGHGSVPYLEPTAPFHGVANVSAPGEDPFVWRDAHPGGGWHVIYHTEAWPNAMGYWPGAHAFAADADGEWHTSRSHGVYSTTVNLTSGRVHQFGRRERAELQFGASGSPWLLVNGMAEAGSSGTGRGNWNCSQAHFPANCTDPPGWFPYGLSFVQGLSQA